MAINKSFDPFFDLTDSRRPPAELKVASRIRAKNPHGTIYENIYVKMKWFDIKSCYTATPL